MAKEYIDNEMKEKISEMITKARIREIMYIDATFNAANLAAFQVQGKLIDSKKNIKPGIPLKKAKSFLENVLDFVIDAAVKSVAGKILSIGFKGVIKPVILSRQAYYSETILNINSQVKVTPNLKVSLNAVNIKKVIERIPKDLPNDMVAKPSSDDFKAFKNLPRIILKDTLDNLVAKVRSQPGASNNQTLNVANDTMSPLVKILRKAGENHLVQKAAIETMYAGLERKLDYSQIDKETGDAWLEFLTKNISIYPQAEIGIISDLIFKWYEFSIWAFMYNSKLIRNDKKLDSKSPRRLTGLSYDEQSRINDSIRDMRNYKILPSEEEENVAYQLPEPTSSYYTGAGETALFKVTLGIPKLVLEYLINTFSPKLNNPKKFTYYNFYDTLYRSKKGMQHQKTGHSDFYQHREDRILIAAYERLFKDIEEWWRNMESFNRRFHLA